MLRLYTLLAVSSCLIQLLSAAPPAQPCVLWGEVRKHDAAVADDQTVKLEIDGQTISVPVTITFLGRSVYRHLLPASKDEGKGVVKITAIGSEPLQKAIELQAEKGKLLRSDVLSNCAVTGIPQLTVTQTTKENDDWTVRLNLSKPETDGLQCVIRCFVILKEKEQTDNKEKCDESGKVAKPENFPLVRFLGEKVVSQYAKEKETAVELRVNRKLPSINALIICAWFVDDKDRAGPVLAMTRVVNEEGEEEL